VISSSQRPVPDNTQQSQQTNFHAPGGIQNHYLSRRAAADLRLRPRGYRDRLFHNTANPKFTFKEKIIIEQVNLAVSLSTRIREAILSILGHTPVVLINFR
jgi:hypothetical protein